MEGFAYKISSSPHVRDSKTTSNLMTDVIIALLPASIFGVYNFGIKAFVLILTCVASCVFFEWAMRRAMKRPATLGDFSAVLTGLLLALNLSSEVPVWMAILGSAFAIVVVKQLFGGLGQNFMNPALGARCFLLISFAGKMTTFTYDGITTATPLAILKSGSGSVNVFDLALGTTAGTIGETSAVCLLVGGAYLIIRRVISPKIPLFYIGVFALCMWIYAINTNVSNVPLYVAAEVCGGGLLLGAFFMATDYVTSPITPNGKIVFGVILGILTFLFRTYGNSAEGVSYAIIFTNLLVPLIERVTQPKSFGKGAENQPLTTDEDAGKMDKKSIAVATVAILAITAVAGAALSYVQQITAEPIARAQAQAKADAYNEVFESATEFAELEIGEDVTVFGFTGTIDEAAAAYDDAGNLLGYVITVTSKEAYDGSLQLVLGITTDGLINGISFLDLNETAGLGMEADSDSFKAQFAGKTVEEFTYTKSGATAEDEIDALSGATITTNAVTNAVNAAITYANTLEGGDQ